MYSESDVFFTLSVRNFQTLNRGRSYDSTIHIQLLSAISLEDRHESAMEQVLSYDYTMRFIGYDSIQTR